MVGSMWVNPKNIASILECGPIDFVHFTCCTILSLVLLPIVLFFYLVLPLPKSLSKFLQNISPRREKQGGGRSKGTCAIPYRVEQKAYFEGKF